MEETETCELFIHDFIDFCRVAFRLPYILEKEKPDFFNKVLEVARKRNPTLDETVAEYDKALAGPSI
jgi:hypothetical protein